MSSVEGTTGGGPSAARAEERDHLLRSLEDLEAEYAAGDLDDADFRTLAADYTTRAAAAIRQTESPAGVTDATSPLEGSERRWLRAGVWIVGLGALAVLTGLLLARFSGSRGAGDTVTGDIRTSIREQLFDAQQAFGTGDLDGAIVIYDEVLEQQPTNAEALAYKGWFINLGGDPVAASVLVEESVAVDPGYADARVFAASLALELGRPEAAADHLAAFDNLDAAPFVDQLVVDFDLRARVAAALDPDSTTALRLAAEDLVARGEVLEALMLFDEVLAARPDDADLHAARGWLMGRLPDDELRGIGVDSLDRALAIEPAHPAALAHRALVRAELGDIDGARTDLAAFDSLDAPPAELENLIVVAGLRELVSTG